MARNGVASNLNSSASIVAIGDPQLVFHLNRAAVARDDSTNLHESSITSEPSRTGRVEHIGSESPPPEESEPRFRW